MKWILCSVFIFVLVFGIGDSCEVIKNYIDCVWKKFEGRPKNESNFGSLCGTEAIPKCLKEVKFIKINKCLNVTQMFQGRSNLNMVSNAAKYLCENNGANIKKFADNGGQKCLDTLNQDLNKCKASDILTIHTKNKENCSAKRNATVCVVELMQEKCKAEIANITSGLFETIFKASPCRACALSCSMVAIFLSTLIVVLFAQVTK